MKSSYKKLKARTKKFKLRDYLYTSKSLDPDLIIGTGGEKRLSNFLLCKVLTLNYISKYPIA